MCCVWLDGSFLSQEEENIFFSQGDEEEEKLEGRFFCLDSYKLI